MLSSSAVRRRGRDSHRPGEEGVGSSGNSYEGPKPNLPKNGSLVSWVY